MKEIYLLVSFLASFRAIASPLGGSDTNIYGSKVANDQPRAAPDPPPASTPLPDSTDGVLLDGSIINYTPNNPTNRQHSCWTAPASRPPPSQPYKPGTCSVCMVQRMADPKDASNGEDYQLWARDNENNAMGNMGPTTVWPIDAQSSTTTNINASVPMGGSPLLLQAALASAPPLVQVSFVWATPPLDASDPTIFAKEGVPAAMFDPASKDGGGYNCVDAGMATGGAVRYAICFFQC